jgi:hypothetical protein
MLERFCEQQGAIAGSFSLELAITVNFSLELAITVNFLVELAVTVTSQWTWQ